jgi:hypothetical protein
MRLAGHVAVTEVRNECKILVGKDEEGIPLGRPVSRREDNIKMAFYGNKAWRYGLYSSRSEDGSVADLVNGNVPSGSI